MKYFQKYIHLLSVIVLSFFTIQSLFTPNFFKVHDDTQVARVYEMKVALSDGIFPVRWVPDLGYNYGYPIFNFYGPLAYYVGGFFNLIGFDSVVATKIMIGLGTLLAGIFMYCLAKEFWGKSGGVISALLYMYAPYHALNIYVRGAIGELWAYGFLPLVFFACYKLFTILSDSSQTKAKKIQNLWTWVTIASFAYAAIIISHNLTAMMITPFLLCFVLFLTLAKKRSYISLFLPLSFLLGIVLSAFYWLPALMEMQYTNVLSVVGGGSDYKDHFVCLTQLWDSPWGFAGSGPGCVDGLSFKLGKIHILLAALSLIPVIILRHKKMVVYAIMLSLTVGIFAIFLTTDFSKFMWDAFMQMAFFQFPWRFLSISMLCLSFLGGAIFLLLPKRPFVQSLVVVGGSICIILLNAKLFVPGAIDTRAPHEYITKSEIAWRVSKISDEYMPKGFLKPQKWQDVPQNKLVGNSNITVVSFFERTNFITADIVAKKQTELLINQAYFPGWVVTIDGKEQTIKDIKKGLLINIPQGKHTIAVKLYQTPVALVGNVLTLTGVFILLAGIILSRKAQRNG